MNKIERNGIVFKLKNGVSVEDAEKLLDAMEQVGSISESQFYRILNILYRIHIPIWDIPNHGIADFYTVGVGELTKKVFIVLGADESKNVKSTPIIKDKAKQEDKKNPSKSKDKLMTFSGMQTTWEGLWYHPEYGGYSSASISLAELKKFKGNCRLYVRKNKYYKKGSNKPNYVFCIKGSQSPTFTETSVIEDRFQRLYTEDELQEEIRKATEGLYTREQVKRVMDGAAADGMRGYGPGDNIIEDYI